MIFRRCMFIAFLAITLAPLFAQQWQSIGPRHFSAGTVDNQSLNCFVKGDVPYVIYSDISDSSKLKLEYFDGSSWNLISGLPTHSASYPSILVSGDSIYIAYQDHSNDSKNSVILYDGSNWSYVDTAGFGSGESRFQDLIMHNGELYLAFEESIGSWNFQGVSVMKYDGNGWSYVGPQFFTSNFSNQESLQPEIKFYNNELYIVYTNAASSNSFNEVEILKYNGNSWQRVGTNSFPKGGPAGEEQSIDFLNGEIYVTYLDANSYKVSVQKFDGTNWSYVGNPGFSATVANNPQLLAYNNSIYVAYGDLNQGNGELVVQYFDGTDWQYLGTNPSISADRVPLHKIRAASDGIYVIYADGNGLSPISAMEYGMSTLHQSAVEANDYTVELFPNPVQDVFQIKSDEHIQKVLIYNMQGQLILETHETTVNCETLVSGTYIAKVITNLGQRNKRLIKQ